MIKLLVHCIILVGVLFACGNQTTQQKKVINEETPFQQFVNSVPLITLPFGLSSNEAINHLTIDSPVIPEGAALIGKLPSQDSRHLLIYSYPADIRLPILELYDSNGTKLKEVNLFNYGACPVTSSGFSSFQLDDYARIFLETACDLYDSRIDRDTLFIDQFVHI